MTIKVNFEEGFEEKFRELAMKKYGFSKGVIKKASEKAIKNWVNKEEIIPKVNDSFSLVRGMMKEFRGKYTSVELQHEAIKLWAKKK